MHTTHSRPSPLALALPLALFACNIPYADTGVESGVTDSGAGEDTDAGTTDADAVIDALPGIETPNLTGGISTMLPNHHITKPVLIGEIQADGQFEVVSETEDLVPGDAWSDFLAESKPLKSDWVELKCGNYNTETSKCLGAM